MPTILNSTAYRELESLENNTFRTFLGLIWNNKVKTIVDVLKENLKDNIYVVEYIFNFLILRDLITNSDIELISDVDMRLPITIKTNQYYLNNGEFSFSVLNDSKENLTLNNVCLVNKFNAFCIITEVNFKDCVWIESVIRKSFLSCVLEKLEIKNCDFIENNFCNLDIIESNIYESNFFHNTGSTLYLKSVKVFDSKIGSEVEFIRMEECEFNNVLFEDISTRNGLLFKKCTFIDCTFVECLENYGIVFESCTIKGNDFRNFKDNIVKFENTIYTE